ncbi:hypothetical protein SRHO_G00123570 [Serrasalmus rhombeus]
MSETKPSDPDLHGLEVRSECSSSCSSSQRSSKSSVSIAAARALAKAEAARLEAEYAKQEIAMKVEKAQIDANASIKKARIEATLSALKEDCEAEAASAKAKVLEAAIDVEIDEHRNERPPSQSRSTPEAVRELWRRSSEGLTEEQSRRLWALLQANLDVFAAWEEDCTRTSLVQHQIDTGSTAPIRLRAHRLPIAKQQAAEQTEGNG